MGKRSYLPTEPASDTNMSGIVTFESLEAAQRAGFEVYDRSPSGWLVRTRTSAGYALALVPYRKALR